MEIFMFLFYRTIYSLLITIGLYEYAQDKMKILRYFLIILVVNLLLVGILEKYAMVVTLFIITSFMVLFERKSINDTLFETISTITIVMIAILFVSSIGAFVLVFAKQLIIYNIIMGILMLLAFILTQPLRSRYAAIRPSEKVKMISNIALSLFIILHGIILPSIEGISYSRMTAIISLINILVIISAHYTFVYISSTENEKRLHEAELRSASDILKKALIDNHYSLCLAKSIALYLDADNLDGLKEYFYTKVEPFMNTELKKIDALKNLEDDLIKNLIYLTKKRADNGQIPMIIEVRGFITDIDMDIFHLFKILSIYFDNAIEASENCDNPQVCLIIQNNPGSVSFELSNRFTGSDQKEIPLLNRGNGLTFADGYIAKYRNVTKHTQIKDDIFTQKLTIGGRERWAK